jgi:hypothetical protein
VVDRSPQVDHLAVELHVHLIKMPAPMAKAAHGRDTLPADVGREQRAKAVPPVPHRLATDIVPRSKSRSSTFRNESGKRTYIMTPRRITSGDELK